MHREDARSKPGGFSRREFLTGLSASVPTLSLASRTLGHVVSPGEPGTADLSRKFTPVDLSTQFNMSAREFGPRDRARASLGGESAKDGLVRVPFGKCRLQGAPFWLGPEGVDNGSWIALSTESRPHTARSLEINIGQKAHFICLASFCDWDPNETPPVDNDAFEQVGEELGRCFLIYEDASHNALSIRRRFETNSPREQWGHDCATAWPPAKWRARNIRDPLASGLDWGDLQECTAHGTPHGQGVGDVWVCALENPNPERSIRSLRFEASGPDLFLLAGVTLYHLPEYPFRYERLAVYRITLPETDREAVSRWKVDVDLGVVVRTYALPDFPAEDWLRSPAAGLGEEVKPAIAPRHLYVDVAASLGATLTLQDTDTGKRLEFDLGLVKAGEELAGEPHGSQIELLVRDKQWVHGRVLDSVTHQPTP
ncbi:MAG: hypothetical protein ACRD2B_13905, partial [Terriglobia bacterium]